MSNASLNKIRKIEEVYRRLGCKVCPPNKGCNSKRKSKRTAKPKGYKKPCRVV